MNISKTLLGLISAASILTGINSGAETNEAQNAKELISIHRSRSGGSAMSSRIKIRRSPGELTENGKASLNPESLPDARKYTDGTSTTSIPLSRSGGSQGSNNIEIKE